jgi:hypothetical protein
MCCTHAVTGAMLMQTKQDIMIELVMESGIDNGDTLLLICPSKFSGPIQQGIGLGICTPENVYGYSFMYDIHDDNGNLINGVPETQDVKHNELQGKEVCVVQLCD